MNLNNKIGLYIRTARKNQGITEKQLAKLIFISQQQVSRYERGINSISLELVFNILNVLNIPIDDFIEKIIKPEKMINELKKEILYREMINELEKEGIITDGIVTDTHSSTKSVDDDSLKT